MKKFGYGKGALSKAAEEALSLWSERSEVADEFLDSVQDPVSSIEGLLKHVKGISSVDLQKQANRSRIRKALERSGAATTR
jgi:hypothetical protein